MNYDDFLRIDIDAFGEVCEAYNEREEMSMRGDWERIRELARCSLLPYQRKGKSLGREDVMKFPWDHDQGRQIAPRRTMTASEQRERMKKLAEAQGIKMA